MQHRRATKTENEMKKILTKTDIKAIVKAYNLSEAEQDELNSYAQEINDEQRNGYDTISATHCALFSSLPREFRGAWAADLDAAATAAVLYIAKRIQHGKFEAGELYGEAHSLTGISRQLAYLLGETAETFKWFFIGLYSQPRWSKAVYTAHKCGLDELVIY